MNQEEVQALLTALASQAKDLAGLRGLLLRTNLGKETHVGVDLVLKLPDGIGGQKTTSFNFKDRQKGVGSTSASGSGVEASVTTEEDDGEDPAASGRPY